MKQYNDLLTWSHPFGDNAFAHHDGAVSVAIHWDGLDAEMLSPIEIGERWSQIYTLISSIKVGYCAEMHFFRESDSSLADDYIVYGQKMVRGKELGAAVRSALAEHLRPFGMTNRAVLILTALPPSGLFLSAKRKLVKQGHIADELLSEAQALASRLPGGRVATSNEYAMDIIQAADRDFYLRGHRRDIDPRFSLAEQLLSAAPQLHPPPNGDLVKLGDSLCKVMLVSMYPNSQAGWFSELANLSVPFHAVQIIIPVNTSESLRASERASDLAEGTLGRTGRSEQAKALNDLAGFQAFVAENNLDIFRNSFILHLHGNEQELNINERTVKDLIEGGNGQVRTQSWTQLPYFRSGLPGQGYRCPTFRSDHTWQVGDMAPVQVYGTGLAPESLRLGTSGALVGFSTSAAEVPHSFTVAMTGAGKGVEKVAEIAETFPMGIDWYIAEIGGSYRWIVEGFGGIYSHIDPTETVVNPLPPYSISNKDSDLPLDAVIAGSTVNALAFLLTDGQTSLGVHHAAAAQSALQMLYAVPSEENEAPTLVDLLSELEGSRDKLESDSQKQAAREMAQNLESFLDTTEGRIFSRQDNLVLSEGITGVDLKEVDKASPKLLKFYLIFLALRFGNLAFAKRTPARVLLDEMHKLVKVAPNEIGRLISELARMGRKDAAAIDLVTQGTTEIDLIESEVLNSMPLRTLLYRSDGWESIANRIDMPTGPLNIWRKYKYPIGQNWRPGIKCVNQNYYDLYLTFPNILLDLSASSPGDLDLKDRIGSKVSDPFERLRLFRESKESIK